MKKRVAILAWVVMAGWLTAAAQADCTSRITNPSFEQDAEGWTHKGMGAQGNNVFDIKDGNIYMEKWTGRGGAVGDGYLSQVISDLPPGNYELTAAAQNIQENTPTAAQTGAYIFAQTPESTTLSAKLNKTTVTVRDNYTVAFNFVSGSVTIGFEAVGASGNWIAVDNFRLTQVGIDLTAELAEAIKNAEAAYGNVTGKESQQLLEAIARAHAVYSVATAQPESAIVEDQVAAIVGMERAIDTYLCANASPEQPWDLTGRIVNPSFEQDGLNGWTATGMGVQGNNVFNIKQGSYYVERWTGKGGAVCDGRVVQRLTGMMPGRYRLKAAAQNIQEDSPKAAQTGAWLFANTHQETVTVRGEYTLEFVLVSDELEIGFEAKGATGNWIAVDNFRLEYIGDSFEDIKAAFAELIAKGEALTTQKTNVAAHQTLEEALAAAKAAYDKALVDDGFSVIATALESAIATATASQEVFARLAAAIAAARELLTTSTATQKDEYQAAIDTAQGIYDAAATTDADAEAAITALAEATFAFRVLGGGETSQAPKVKTDPRFIRGCQWAFGRSTVSGKDIIEEGFCWSEQPDPKVTDNRTTEYINQAGKIYWLRDLKPATVYYMRTYAINKDYAVGYGDVIKVVTVPKGTVGHWYNNGGDEETNDRINYAINTAMDYYWNNLSSIHGFGISVTYSPGTPTADCSYGGSMRVGASSSYQQPGTIMHEALHGIGVGTHGNWWSGDYRPNGVWAGNRVTEALRFWDNNTDGELHGDDMHLWPYGCNGAHEDTHNDNLYCMMGILAQALNEDGLPASGEIGYALPYYAFNHEDTVKYYIKNEDEKRGLRTAYLVETATHQLQWKTMTAEEAMTDDAAAWYLTFTPSNQYYQLRNAATGYYMTYASGFKTAKHSKPVAADNIHLMPGHVEAEGHRSFYFIHPESTANPPALNASTSGKTASASWNIANSATTQRWLILTAQEAENLDNGNADLARAELEELLAHVRELTQTPHAEAVEGADETLETLLADIESQAPACTKGIELEALIQQARDGLVTFLSSVSATDETHLFDLTFMLENPDFDSDATTGWTSTNGAPGYGAQAAEFYERTFDFYQILEDMPAGDYQLRAYAFQRPGAYGDVLAPYINGTAKVTSSLYINSKSAAVKHICDDRQAKALYTGDGYDQKLSDGTYIPNTMTGASKYFAKGLYDSSVDATLAKAGTKLRVGIKCTSAPSRYWTMFDHFRLYFYGQDRTLVGIKEVENEGQMVNGKWSNGKWSNGKWSNGKCYDLQGRRISDSSEFHVQGSRLRKGLYIVQGKKVVISK
ncbi:MAG: hypothetical protein IJT75_03840 [Bacteroidaceae bacterium]|nr:hypothetical protein [Bacteroidaceae bacterium]